MPHAARALATLFAALFAALIAGDALGQAREFQLDPRQSTFEETSNFAEGSDEALLAEARELIARGEAKSALRILNPWIRANERAPNPWLPQAYLLRGDALVIQGREFRALYDYELIARSYAATPEFLNAIEREIEVAERYLNGLRRKILGLRVQGARNTGEELMIRAQERLPGSPLAERAAITLADHYFEERKLRLAADMYGIFVQNFPRSDEVKRARLNQIFANVGAFPGPAYDASTLIEARILLDEYAADYPAETVSGGIVQGLADRVDESQALSMLETARWYLRRGDESSARFTLRRLIRRHPATSTAREAFRVMQDRGWVEDGMAQPTPEGAASEATRP